MSRTQFISWNRSNAQLLVALLSETSLYAFHPSRAKDGMSQFSIMSRTSLWVCDTRRKSEGWSWLGLTGLYLQLEIQNGRCAPRGVSSIDFSPSLEFLHLLIPFFRIFFLLSFDSLIKTFLLQNLCISIPSSKHFSQPWLLLLLLFFLLYLLVFFFPLFLLGAFSLSIRLNFTEFFLHSSFLCRLYLYCTFGDTSLPITHAKDS